MRFYFLGMIPSMIYNMGSGIFRAVGDARRPLYFLAVCCVLNIVLDLLLVVVIPLGTAGAAIATSIAQVICAVLVLVSLCRTKDIFRLHLKRIYFQPSLLSHMLRIGLPAGVQSSMYSISNVFIQAFINGLGTDSIAAWAAFRKVDSVYWPISSALGITVMTFVGQNFGARRYDRLKSTIRTGFILQFSITAAIVALMVLFRNPLIAIFNEDTAVREIGGEILLAITPYYFLYICIEILSGAMRGVSESLKPALLTVGGICALRLVYLFLFVGDTPTNSGIAFSYPLTWGVTTVLFIIYYLRGRWLRHHIQQQTA